jgi:DNA-binding NtrC family response regulator
LPVPLETDSQQSCDATVNPNLMLHEGGLSLPVLKEDLAGQISVYEKTLFIDDLLSNGLKATLADIERGLIESVLYRVDRNVSECARVLGVKRTTLIAKLEKLDIR